MGGGVRACPYAEPDFEGKTPYKRYCRLLGGEPCNCRIIKCPYLRKLHKVTVAEKLAEAEGLYPRIEVKVAGMDKLEKLGVKVPKVMVEIEPASR